MNTDEILYESFLFGNVLGADAKSFVMPRSLGGVLYELDTDHIVSPNRGRVSKVVFANVNEIRDCINDDSYLLCCTMEVVFRTSRKVALHNPEPHVLFFKKKKLVPVRNAAVFSRAVYRRSAIPFAFAAIPAVVVFLAMGAVPAILTSIGVIGLVLLSYFDSERKVVSKAVDESVVYGILGRS